MNEPAQAMEHATTVLSSIRDICPDLTGRTSRRSPRGGRALTPPRSARPRGSVRDEIVNALLSPGTLSITSI